MSNIIEKARNDNSVILIHCMAGISRSVTLTIAYIMAFFNLSMQDAYQYVKDKRPAISPNLNFMGQLVEFERHCQEKGPRDSRDMDEYEPTQSQKEISKKLMQKIVRSGSNVSLTGKVHHIFESMKSIDKSEPEGVTVSANKPFVLKPLNPKARRPKKSKESVDGISTSPLRDLVENSKPLLTTEDNSINNIKNNMATTNNTDLDPTKSSLTISDISESGLPGPCSNDDSMSRPSRPKSPRQLVVMSFKGERMNLQHRMEGRSPSPSPDRSTSPNRVKNSPESINKGQS